MNRQDITPLSTELDSKTSDPVLEAPGSDVEKGLAEGSDIVEDKREPSVVDAIDPYLVNYASPTDPTNPYNYPLTRKWAITLLLSLNGLVTLMSSTMMAAALPSISQDLHTDSATTQLTLSIFVLSFAFGPMVLAPLTEVFGRKPVWIASGCFYILWNTVCGFAKSNGVLIAARFMAGLGASAEYSIVLPVRSDVWRPEQMGQSLAIATFLPFLGPALGPILGGVLTGSIGWRWVFWVVSIFDAVLMLCALLVFPETHVGTILHRKAKTLRKQTGEPYYAEHERESQSLARRLAISLTRPVRLLATQPVIQLMSLFLAYNYGILFIVQSTFAVMWIERYGQSVSVSGLHYIALAVGCIFASLVGSRIMDRVWKHLKTRAEGETQPEFRVPLMMPGVIIIPAGLLWYGWTAQAHAFWLLPDIGIAIFGAGIIVGTQAMQAYVMDSFPKYVASASAASSLLRSIAGFAFPLFAPQMYQTLGYGWGNSLLAGIFLVIGIPAPFVLWKYGAWLRAKGKPQW